MVCKNCGSALNPNERFCRYCGTAVTAENQAGTPPTYSAPGGYNGGYANQGSYSQNPGNQNGYYGGQGYGQNQNYYAGQNAYQNYQEPAKKGPKFAKQSPKKPIGKKGLLIGGIAAAVAVVVLVVVLLVSGNPSAKVASAFGATVKELGAMADTFGVKHVADVMKSESLSQDVELKLNSADEYYVGSEAALLSGLGVRIRLDADLDKRHIGIQAVPYYGSVDIATATVSLEDEMVYLALPELLPDSYGLNTVTLMQDLEAMGADLGEASEISFNFFEMVDIIRTQVKEGQDLSAKEMEKANSELIKALEVEKDGKRNIRINGKSTKCTAYIVTIPQNALENWVYALEDSSEAVDYQEMMETVFESMNLPSDIVDELVDEMSYYYETPDFSEIYDLLDELGDVELEVYVNGGKVAGLVFEEDVYDSEVELGLYIGGKENYTDQISFTLTVDNEEYTVVSEGDHGAKDGIFTDETTFTYTRNNTVYTDITLVTEYDTKADSDNLTMELKEGDMVIALEGTYLAKKDQLVLEAEDLAILDGSEELISLSVGYSANKYSKRVSADNAVLLSELTQDDLMQIVTDIESNATTWAMGLLEKIPELAELM